MLVDQAEEPVTLPEDATPRVFKPEWEVDRFLWTELYETIENRIGDDLHHAVCAIEGHVATHRNNVVAVTQNHAADGATTMAVCLARQAAREGRRVILVDLHHSRPAAGNHLGVEVEQGVESLESLQMKPEEICIAAVEDGLTLVPAVSPFPADVVIRPAVCDLVHRASESYDLVILDTSVEVARLLTQQKTFGQMGLIVVRKSQAPMQLSADFVGDAGLLGVIENYAA